MQNLRTAWVAEQERIFASLIDPFEMADPELACWGEPVPEDNDNTKGLRRFLGEKERRINVVSRADRDGAIVYMSLAIAA